MVVTDGFYLGTTNFSATVQKTIIRNMVALLRAAAVYADPATISPLTRSGPSTWQFLETVMTDLGEPSLSALAEGVPPSPLKGAFDTLSVTATEIGDYIRVYSQAESQASGNAGTPGQLVQHATERIARRLFLVHDALAKSIISASTPAIYAGDATSLGSIDVGDVLTTALVDNIVTTLRERDVKPIQGYYRIVGAPRAFIPLQEEAANTFAGFATVDALNGGAAAKSGTIGFYHGAQFISAGSRAIDSAAGGASSANVATLWCYGEESLLMTPPAPVVIASPGGGPSDPLHQIVMDLGYREIIGGAINSLASNSDGAGNLVAGVQRGFTALVSEV